MFVIIVLLKSPDTFAEKGYKSAESLFLYSTKISISYKFFLTGGCDK